VSEASPALCLHGLGGTGATMHPVVDTLSTVGFDVVAPTLPGHGTTPDDLLVTAWRDLLAVATARWWAVIVGQSMGADLALAAAAAGCAAAVVAINPLAPDPDAVDGLEWRRDRGQLWHDAPPLADGEAGYATLPVEALLAMARGVADLELAAVTVPVLVVTSIDDDVVDPASSDLVAAALGGTVERLRLDRGSHVATLGPQQATLLAAIAAFSAPYVK
jgi:carboxylesterase